MSSEPCEFLGGPVEPARLNIRGRRGARFGKHYLHIARVSASGSASMSKAATSAPACAAPIDNARPRPRPAPVTSMDFPDRSNVVATESPSASRRQDADHSWRSVCQVAGADLADDETRLTVSEGGLQNLNPGTHQSVERAAGKNHVVDDLKAAPPTSQEGAAASGASTEA